MPTAKQIPWAPPGSDADHRTGGIDQRAAGVAGIERRVCLDDGRDWPAITGAQRATKTGDNAHGDGGLETEGIADGKDKLTNPQVAAAAERGMIEAVAVQP
jgi:hypothetical protein